jgi:phytol kinase
MNHRFTIPLILRKAIHAALAVAMVLLAFAGGPTRVIETGAALVIVFGLALLLRPLDPLRLAERASYGEFFFALAVIAAALLFLPSTEPAFAAGMLVLGFADSTAAVIGRRWGRNRYVVFGEERSYEGSFAAFVVSALVLYASGIGVLWAVVGGWLLAAVEAFAPRGSDNLILPLLAGAIVAFVA